MCVHLNVQICTHILIMLLCAQKREKWGKRPMDNDYLFPSYTFPAPGPNAKKTDLLKTRMYISVKFMPE